MAEPAKIPLMPDETYEGGTCKKRNSLHPIVEAAHPLYTATIDELAE